MASENMSEATRRMRSVLAPVRAAETRRAEEAAVTSFLAALPRDCEQRFRILGSAIRIEKPRRRGAVPPRLIRVLLADYGNGRLLAITVNSSGRVVDTQTSGFRPAFHPDEIREARAIAERDERVRRWARRRGSFVSPFFPEGKGEVPRRLVGLLYVTAGKDGRKAPLGSTAVDLFRQEPVALGDASHLAMEGGNRGRVR